jgi:hypothetical protein
VLHPPQRDGLDRRAPHVGVEPDVAEEHAVRMRHVLAAQRDRLRAAEAVGHGAQALAQLGRARAVARFDLRPRDAQSRELLVQLGVDEAGPHAPASRSWSTTAPVSCRPSAVAVTRPPRSANVIVGHTATA